MSLRRTDHSFGEVVVCDLETSREEAKSPLKGCEYKPTMGCDTEKKKTAVCVCVRAPARVSVGM